jgi:hypothetical protein
MVAATKADRRTMKARANDIGKKTVTDTEPNWVNPFTTAVAVQNGAGDDGGNEGGDEADGSDPDVSLCE